MSPNGIMPEQLLDAGGLLRVEVLDRAAQVEQRGRDLAALAQRPCCIARTGDASSRFDVSADGADVVVAHRSDVAGLGGERRRVHVEGRRSTSTYSATLASSAGQRRRRRSAPCRRPCSGATAATGPAAASSVSSARRPAGSGSRGSRSCACSSWSTAGCPTCGTAAAGRHGSRPAIRPSRIVPLATRRRSRRTPRAMAAPTREVAVVVEVGERDPHRPRRAVEPAAVEQHDAARRSARRTTGSIGSYASASQVANSAP